MNDTSGNRRKKNKSGESPSKKKGTEQPVPKTFLEAVSLANWGTENMPSKGSFLDPESGKYRIIHRTSRELTLADLALFAEMHRGRFPKS